MAANAIRYGFRWASSENGKSCPQGVPMLCASGVSFTPGSATAARLRVGDPVKRLASGYIDHADPGNAIWGIMTGVGHDGKTFNATIGSEGAMHPSEHIASGIAWGTNFDRKTIALITPGGGAYWEVDYGPAALADEAAWIATYGQCADHTFTAPGAGDLYANPKLGVAIAAVGSGQWRIERVSDTQLNQDFNGLNLKILVTLNEGQAPPYLTAGV